MSNLYYCTLLRPNSIFTDSRGTVQTFFPQDPIHEYNIITTKSGDKRGSHMHPEFDEYIVVLSGSCKFREGTPVDGKKYLQWGEEILRPGDTLQIPSSVAHEFIAIGEFKFISMLTKKWDESIPQL